MALAGRLLNQLVKTGRRVIPQPRLAPASALDTITNPKTYMQLADDATDALGQLLPPQFRGAGFQNVPTKALGALDDLTDLPAGPIKEMAQRRAAKEFSKAAGSGTQRIPVIPTGGIPVRPGTVTMLDDAARTLKTPGALNNLRGALSRGAVPLIGGAIDAGLRINDGENPVDAIGRSLFGASGASLGAAGAGLLGVPTGPGAFATGLAGGIAGYNAGTGLYDNVVKPGFMDFIQNPAMGGGMPGADVLSTPDVSYQEKGTSKDNRPQQGAGLDMAAIRQQSARAEAARKAQEQKNPKVGPTPDYSLDPTPRVQPPAPGAPPNTPTVTPGTPIPQSPDIAARPYAPSDQAGNVAATYGLGTSTMPHANPANTVLPPNAEQVLQADPMQIYEQARSAAVGQDQNAMNKVRDLGLALHRQQFPNLYETPNSVPAAMTAKDQGSALNEIEPSQIDQALLGIYEGKNPVLDPNKFLQVQLQGRVAR